ncbi:hypothetical protein EYR38_004915 [Pleurotus pulmonarius]|nr:hypothetical protein EYR38_004915 [Pleurotus pulmonarius]
MTTFFTGTQCLTLSDLSTMSDYGFDARSQRSHRATPSPSEFQGGSMVGAPARGVPARTRLFTPAPSEFQGGSTTGDLPRGLPVYNDWAEPAIPNPQAFPTARDKSRGGAQAERVFHPPPHRVDQPFRAPRQTHADYRAAHPESTFQPTDRSYTAAVPFPYQNEHAVVSHYPPAPPAPTRHYEEASPVTDPAYAWQEFVVVRRIVRKLEDKVARLEELVLELKQTCFSIPSRLHASTPSLGPSDSISRTGNTSHVDVDDGEEELLAAYQVYLRRPDTLEKPPEIPDSVLWTFKSAQDIGALAGLSAKNHYRPSFHKALRDAKGKVLDPAVVKLIKRTASSLADRILAIHPLDQVQVDVKQIREYYRSKRPDLWYGSITVLETRHKEVALCSAHWKADHLIGQSITNARKAAKKAQTGEADSDDDEGPVHGTLKKRPAGATTPLPSVPPSKRPRVGEKPRALPKPLHGRPAKLPDEPVSNATVQVDRSPSPAPTNEPIPSVDVLSPTLSAPSVFTPSSFAPSSSMLQPPPPPPSSSVSSAPPSLVFPGHNALSMIKTDDSYENLQRTIQSSQFQFPEALINLTMDLLAAMEQSPRHGGYSFPSTDVSTLLVRVQTADPACMENEEDLQDSWGHWQWTSGSLTIAGAITSWNSVGNTETARQLIAAALTTCKAARYLCIGMSRKPQSYLSDVYLDRIVSTLSDAWKRSGGPLNKGKARAVVSEPAAPPEAEVTNPSGGGGDLNEVDALAESEGHPTANDDPQSAPTRAEDTAFRKKLEEVHLPDLKTLAAKKQISNARSMNKATCVSALFNLPPCSRPSTDELDAMIAKRVKKAKPPKSAKSVKPTPANRSPTDANDTGGAPEGPDETASAPRLIAKATDLHS